MAVCIVAVSYTHLDVYEVKMEDGKEVLLPAIRECIKNVDLQKGEITVHVMKGLLDE